MAKNKTEQQVILIEVTLTKPNGLSSAEVINAIKVKSTAAGIKVLGHAAPETT